MASELSRLIDDELVKFERRPSIEEKKPQRSAFNVKSPPQEEGLLSRFPWGQREWWTWKRIGYAALAGILFFLCLYAWARVGAANSAAKSDSGISSLLSSTDSSHKVSSEEPAKAHHVNDELEPPSALLSGIDEDRSGSLNATQIADTNAIVPAAFGPTLLGASRDENQTFWGSPSANASEPSLQISVAPGPLEAGEPAFAPSPGLVGNSTAPVGSPISDAPEEASAPVPMSPGDGIAPSPNSTDARPPIVGMGFKIGRRKMH